MISLVKTLIKPWKGLKLYSWGVQNDVIVSENPNKTLEGIKTLDTLVQHSFAMRLVKTLIKPWKGLKLQDFSFE
ncbi:hypothetical protein U27_01450 [Candidatus Vecturithrix granuli]|uniref:Uncharacterized protein n=1 Tax=Vecturithrix granuli TaxID=1499967 RepID=A0A081CAE4_VECG1|nr:hypothetical protein U27_01450 [Candidatus Vecturithrix granuli]